MISHFLRQVTFVVILPGMISTQLINAWSEKEMEEAREFCRMWIFFDLILCHSCQTFDLISLTQVTTWFVDMIIGIDMGMGIGMGMKRNLRPTFIEQLHSSNAYLLRVLFIEHRDDTLTWEQRYAKLLWEYHQQRFVMNLLVHQVM